MAACTVLVLQAQDLVLLLGFAGLLILAVGVGRGRRVRDFLRFVWNALYDEWNRPR